jgi:hypothetical protein
MNVVDRALLIAAIPAAAFLSPVHAVAAAGSEPRLVIPESPVLLAEGRIRFSVAQKGDGFALVVEIGGKRADVDGSPKPAFRILPSGDFHYIVVSRPVGFATMVDVFDCNIQKQEMKLLFSSSESNNRPFVDYVFDRWALNEAKVVFKVYENMAYSTEKRASRLLSIEHIYLDGKTKYK